MNNPEGVLTGRYPILTPFIIPKELRHAAVVRTMRDHSRVLRIKVELIPAEVRCGLIEVLHQCHINTGFNKHPSVFTYGGLLRQVMELFPTPASAMWYNLDPTERELLTARALLQGVEVKTVERFKHLILSDTVEPTEGDTHQVSLKTREAPIAIKLYKELQEMARTRKLRLCSPDDDRLRLSIIHALHDVRDIVVCMTPTLTENSWVTPHEHENIMQNSPWLNMGA